MDIKQIRDWILIVARIYKIKDVHHMWRPDSKLKKPQEYFTFEIVSTQPTDTKRIIDETLVGKDITYKITKRYETIVQVTAYSERGAYLLQALESIREMPQVKKVLGVQCECFGCGPITSEPWIDESSKESIYRTDFRFVEGIEHSFTETNMLVEEVAGNGLVDDVVFAFQAPEPEEEIPEPESI
jgi:DNA-binding Lrp family transcriptional regulator